MDFWGFSWNLQTGFHVELGGKDWMSERSKPSVAWERTKWRGNLYTLFYSRPSRFWHHDLIGQIADCWILPTPLVFISGYANTEIVLYCLNVSLCLMIFLCPFLHCKALRTAMYKRYINTITIIPLLRKGECMKTVKIGPRISGYACMCFSLFSFLFCIFNIYILVLQ